MVKRVYCRAYFARLAFLLYVGASVFVWAAFLLCVGASVFVWVAFLPRARTKPRGGFPFYKKRAGVARARAAAKTRPTKRGAVER